MHMCDKHINKMTVESWQLLSAAIYRHDPDLHAEWYAAGLLSKVGESTRGWVNGPFAVWAAASRENWLWLHEHAAALSDEHWYRWGQHHGRPHATGLKLSQIRELAEAIPPGPLTPFATPEGFTPEVASTNASVAAYRLLYIVDKSRFALWERGRPAPAWYTLGRSAYSV